MNSGGPEQEAGAYQVTEAEQAFGVDPAVGNDTEQAGHKEGGDTHGAVYAGHLATGEMKGFDHISAERDQPGAPYKKFKKIHQDQTEFNSHRRKILVWFCCSACG